MQKDRWSKGLLGLGLSALSLSGLAAEYSPVDADYRRMFTLGIPTYIPEIQPTHIRSATLI